MEYRLIIRSFVIVASVSTISCYQGYDTVRDCNITLQAGTTPRLLFQPNTNNTGDANCWWQIQATDPDNRVVLDTLALRVKKQRNCGEAKVSVFNAVGDIGPAMTTPVRSWCGDGEKRLLYSENGAFYMTADPTYYAEFVFKFYQEKVQSGSIQLLATTAESVLESPGFPNFYYNDTDRRYVITTAIQDDHILLESESFNLFRNDSKQVNDYLSVAQGELNLGRYFGSNGPVIQTTNNTVTLHFKTSHKSPFYLAVGFRLRYRAVKGDNTAPVAGTDNAVAGVAYKNLHVPDAIELSPNQSMDFIWTVRKPRMEKEYMIRITVFYPERERFCSGDLLEVYDGQRDNTTRIPNQHCSIRGPEFQGNEQNMTVYLRYDGSFNPKDVRIRYFVTNEPYPCGRNLTADDSFQSLLSLGYYTQDYDGNLDCVYRIEAPEDHRVLVTARDGSMALEDSLFCRKDYVLIADGPDANSSVANKVCGDDFIVYTSTGRFLTIVFHTDESGAGGGFRWNFRAVKPNETCAKQYLSPLDTRLTITSPLYPQNYPPNVDCVWDLTAPQGHVVFVEVEESSMETSTECSKDYVEAFDGLRRNSKVLSRWCGVEHPSFQSSGIFLTLAFHSDNVTSGSGFRLSYSARPKPVNPRSKTSKTIYVGVVFGVVFGVLALLAIVAGIVVYRRRRSRHMAVTTGRH
ncbi:cubilin-like isoform X1 [Haliotis rufescens]|uniref:cubilin-like isoform X1 n=1 Tax=Haliotis rufescens TaxID=6454 RepID=UPI00201EB28D|nr:cubilin-like isoform X1 [Haliotis rufescens]